MTLSFSRRELGLGRLISISFLCHIAVYALLITLHLNPIFPISEGPVYYVDVVSLPVASPQAGSPVAATTAPPAPQPVPKTPAPAMKLPAAKTAAPTSKTPQNATETASEFEERIARMQKESDARHESAAMEAIRKRVAAGGGKKVGIPGGTGQEAGSDYASYIRSRLVDAFVTTIASNSKDPRVVIRLTIDRNGRISKRRVEASSGDKIFEDSVNRAIVKAEKEFKPPPGGGTFEQGFTFSPEGVVKK